MCAVQYGRERRTSSRTSWCRLGTHFLVLDALRVARRCEDCFIDLKYFETFSRFISDDITLKLMNIQTIVVAGNLKSFQVCFSTPS
eukprot:3938905-Amphidinium_carterae.2